MNKFSTSKKIETDFSWSVPWLAGFLFVVGYVPINWSEVWWRAITEFIWVAIMWPYVLGEHLGGV